MKNLKENQIKAVKIFGANYELKVIYKRIKMCIRDSHRCIAKKWVFYIDIRIYRIIWNDGLNKKRWII